MPLYPVTNRSTLYASHVGTTPINYTEGSRAKEYDTRITGVGQSVYAPGYVGVFQRTHGACLCCGFERDLVNGYCDVCRVMGANEQHCVHPRLLKCSSAQARDNSSGSMWRSKYQKASRR